MKKFLLALVIITLTFSLAACGETNGENGENDNGLDNGNDNGNDTDNGENGDNGAEDTMPPLPDYDVDLSSLDLEGQEINFYTHVVNEDNPFDDGYVHPDGDEYREHLTMLQDTYNFELVFRSWSDYENRVNDVANHVLGSNDSAIIRAPELDFMLDLISAGYLSNFTHVADALQDEYAVNQWQVDAGSVNDNVFAIQNKDGEVYVDLMVYNLDLLEEAGVEKTPSEMWVDGEWTTSAMESYLRTLSLELDNSIYPLAITPYHIGLYGPAANGTKFVDDEGQLQLLNIETLDVLYEYKNWYDYGYIMPLNFDNDVLRHHVADNWQRQEAVFGMAMMWQLSGYAESVSFDFGAVPFPQNDDASKEDYYSPLGSGDLQMVTIGSNADEVATILFLINEFHKDAVNSELESFCDGRDDVSLNECASIMNVQEYLRLTDDGEIERAEKIFTFLQGNSEENAIATNDLAYLNGETQYISAVQEYMQAGGSPRNYIDATIPIIQNNIDRMLEAIRSSRE